MDYFTVVWLAYGIKNPLFIYELNPGQVCNYEECEHSVSRLWNMKLFTMFAKPTPLSDHRPDKSSAHIHN